MIINTHKNLFIKMIPQTLNYELCMYTEENNNEK